jgi:hypothetical protein
MKGYILTVEFVHILTAKGGRFAKVLKRTLSGNRYCYYGKTKKDCIAKAKKSGRIGSQWQQGFEQIENIENYLN